METPKYFPEIEVAHQKHSALLSQRKYAMDLLKGTGLFGCKPTNTPMEANVDLWFDNSQTLDNPRRYRRLIGKLVYTRPDITFVVGVLRRFMHQPRGAHWSAALRILAYIKSCQGKDFVYRKHGYVRIFGYSDSGYTGDRGDMKSTTG